MSYRPDTGFTRARGMTEAHGRGGNQAWDKPTRCRFGRARGRDRSHLSRIRVRDLLSCQSLMPVAAGKPRYEKLGALVDGRVQVSSGPLTPPLAGDKPQRYIPLSTLGCRCWVTVVSVAVRRRN